MIPARFEFYAFVLATCLMLLNYTDGQASSRDASCSQTFSGRKRGQLLSPAYPQEYNTSVICNYAIKIKPNRQVNLTFTKVELEIQNNSLFDFIVLFDGVDCMSQRIAAVVNISNTSYFSSGNSMVALFTSDIKNQTGAFAANFTTVSRSVNRSEPVPPFPENKILERCGEDIKAINGKLLYEGKGGVNHLCIWRITVEYGKMLTFNLTKLSLSYPRNWLRILDGSDCGAPVVYFANGDSEKRLVSLTSTTNTMMVIFAEINGNGTDRIEADYYMVSATPGSQSEGDVVSSEVSAHPDTTPEVSALPGTTSEAGSKLIPMAATNLLLITAARSYALR